MQTRKWLEEGFCPVDRYNCLMPVEYEAEEKNGKVKDFHKKRNTQSKKILLDKPGLSV